MKIYKLVLLVLMVSFGVHGQELVSGKATLTKTGMGIYEIKKNNLPPQKIDIRQNEKNQLAGTLAVLFQDCENLRLSVFEMGEINESKLVKAVEQYNNCTYSPFKPTDKEAQEAANFQGDEYQFFASVGASVNRISFYNLDDYKTLTQGLVSIGIAATPGFVGTLQGNLFFTMEASAALAGDKDYPNSPFKANFKKNSERLQLGTEFRFNKNGFVKPLIGIGIGLARDHYNGIYDGYKLDQRQGSSFVIPKLGVLFSLDDKKSLGVIVSYIPEYQNNLIFIVNDQIFPLEINTHYLNAGLYFYF